MTDALELDAVIFGGGSTGLWTLDELARTGARCLLLEANELGAGQTVASQGIIHGGVKYSLGGLVSSSARAVARMPDLWRACLAGDREPRLVATRLRSHWCVLWQTASLKSRLGMLGARAGLRVTPRIIEPNERPPILHGCPGIVARLDEQVIEPWSFVSDLSERHRSRIMRIDSRNGLEFAFEPGHAHPQRVRSVRLINPDSGDPIDLRSRWIVLAAGAGNATLREACGLAPGAMQRRPLHMVMARGAELPVLNGHCTDGASTRVTITSTRDFSERPVWQIGGQIAERGVALEEPQLTRYARDELQKVLPRFDSSGLEWATYRVDRAEASNAGTRPHDMTVLVEGNVLTTWPTKLVLVPRVAERVRDILTGSNDSRAASGSALLPVHAPAGWPRPTVALPPWETAQQWMRLD